MLNSPVYAYSKNSLLACWVNVFKPLFMKTSLVRRKMMQLEEKVRNQKMKELIDLLKKYNIDFKVDYKNNEILIRADTIDCIDLNETPRLVMYQNETRIIFDTTVKYNVLAVDIISTIGFIRLPRNVRLYYKWPYLTIRF